MRVGHRSGHGEQVHLVTQARRPLSEDIRYRQNRYLIMMGVRTVCLILSVVLFLNHLAWLSVVPVIGAILLPYVAVVFANGGREPENVRGFMEHRMNLPARREPPDEGGEGPRQD